MNNAVQHGRQPTPQAAPPADPRIRNVPANPSGPSTTPTSVTESSGICRDYIWGICTMGAQCIYRHDLEFEAMKETLKFCHDHQNRTGCTRPDCTYLHTTRDEENLFLTMGQVPRVLIDRYHNMSYVSQSSRAGTESVPPQMYEYIAQPPPPPPPPPSAQSGPMLHSPRQTQQQQMQGTLMISPIQGAMNGAIQGPMQGPMPCPMPSPIQGPMQGPMPCPMPGPMQGPIQGPMPCPGPMQGPMPGPIQGPMQGPMQHPMQGPMTAPMPQMPAPMQPPPPPPPPTSSVSSSRMSGPVYTGGHPASSNLFSTHYQPATNKQSLPAIFDPTRPPPPFKKQSLKRCAEDCEAGPSKLRKSETSHESSCEKCMQRLIRVEFYSQQINKIKQENEMNRAEGAAKVQEFEQKKQLIQTMLTPQMFRLAEEYIESGTPTPSLSALNAALSEVFPTSNSFLPKPNSNNSSSSSLLNSLLNIIVARERDAEPALMSSDASLLQQLTSRLRPMTANGSSELLTSILDIVRNSPTERNPSESRSAAVSVGNGPARSFSEAGPSSVRPYEGVGPSPSRPFEGAGPSPSRPYESAGPSPSRPYEGAGPSPSRPYDAAGSTPSRPYDSTVASMTYTEMSPYEPVRYPPPTPASTAPANGQYHSGMELSAMPQGARPVPAPTVQFPGPGPYGPPQTQAQAQGPPSRPFYVQMPPYNGGNPPYPGMLPQAGRPPMQPPQNPPNNLFFGTRYPNYYPPYQ